MSVKVLGWLVLEHSLVAYFPGRFRHIEAALYTFKTNYVGINIGFLTTLKLSNIHLVWGANLGCT